MASGVMPDASRQGRPETLMTIPFKCVCRTIGLRASLGRFNDSLATVSIKDEAVVDELRLRQTLCILHHMQKIRADRCCRINAPVGRLGPCSNANQNQSSNENANLTHLNSPVDMDSPPVR